ncbi:tRNA pseudouridine(38-40) synthase TruA [Desulfopila sp. IMCC35008]|uniref:tRNA pseudouridine(38-40) synthase TruA n=1 Tax=Desulfopila sp. IMCC35008 TaxID=2653858 RepID=UPI0013D5D769|nr:tRNA pseudouridine(38-40) synthase TruA [Desulfopila sp. IMCC35008]
MSNYRLTVSYDGRNYLGWQRHGDKPTVQYALEQAVEQIFNIRSAVRGSGRTDRGAHANGQVASVELPADLQVDEVKEQLNDLLAETVRVVDVSHVPFDFHACDSAIGKRYRYLIWNSKKLPSERDGRVWHVKSRLDVEAMINACSVFEGQHDFASFATRPNFKQKTTTRTVSRAVMSHDLPLITFDICADGFLYKMVRNIVRAIVKVGEGRYTRDDLCRILEMKDRKAAPGTAPASGLYLEKVYYKEEEMIEDATGATFQ